MKILTIVCLLLLAGCATQPVPMSLVPNEDDKKPVLEAEYTELLQPCSKMPNMVDNPTKTEVLQHHTEEVLLYNDCSRKQEALAALIRKIFNVME